MASKAAANFASRSRIKNVYRSVRSLVVVVPHVLVENPPKMTPTPDQHPLQTLLPDRPHPALRERVRTWCPHRGLQGLDALPGEDGIEGVGELRVPVANKELELPDALVEVHEPSRPVPASTLTPASRHPSAFYGASHVTKLVVQKRVVISVAEAATTVG